MRQMRSNLIFCQYPDSDFGNAPIIRPRIVKIERRLLTAMCPFLAGMRQYLMASNCLGFRGEDGVVRMI
jgi:hypothetical protein